MLAGYWGVPVSELVPGSYQLFFKDPENGAVRSDRWVKVSFSWKWEEAKVKASGVKAGRPQPLQLPEALEAEELGDTSGAASDTPESSRQAVGAPVGIRATSVGGGALGEHPGGGQRARVRMETSAGVSGAERGVIVGGAGSARAVLSEDGTGSAERALRGGTADGGGRPSYGGAGGEALSNVRHESRQLSPSATRPRIPQYTQHTGQTRGRRSFSPPHQQPYPTSPHHHPHSEELRQCRAPGSSYSGGRSPHRRSPSPLPSTRPRVSSTSLPWGSPRTSQASPQALSQGQGDDELGARVSDRGQRQGELPRPRYQDQRERGHHESSAAQHGSGQVDHASRHGTTAPTARGRSSNAAVTVNPLASPLAPSHTEAPAPEQDSHRSPATATGTHSGGGRVRRRMGA